MSVTVLAIFQPHIFFLHLYYLVRWERTSPIMASEALGARETQVTLIAMFSSSSCLYNISLLHTLPPFLYTSTCKYLDILQQLVSNNRCFSDSLSFSMATAKNWVLTGVGKFTTISTELYMTKQSVQPASCLKHHNRHRCLWQRIQVSLISTFLCGSQSCIDVLMYIFHLSITPVWSRYCKAVRGHFDHLRQF